MKQTNKKKYTQFAFRKTIYCAETAVKINLETKQKNDLYGSVGVNLKVTTQSNEHWIDHLIA